MMQTTRRTSIRWTERFSDRGGSGLGHASPLDSPAPSPQSRDPNPQSPAPNPQSPAPSPQSLAPNFLAAIVLLLGVFPAISTAEEIFLQDGRRAMAMVESIDGKGTITLRLPNGRMRNVPLDRVATITFRGREPRAIPAGAQEFHLVGDNRLMGQIVRMDGNAIVLSSPATGTLSAPMGAIRGFLTMPLEGTAGRRAVELVTGDDDDEPTGMLDRILDRRAAPYAGMIEAINDKDLRLDHERMRKTVPIKILYLAGVRLARETRNERPALPEIPFVKIHTRDNSSVDGVIESVHHGQWRIRPRWDDQQIMSFSADEITAVEVLGGAGVYLSQLPVAEEKEETILAPRQRYGMNRNCQDQEISLGGNSYAWGIGVHANSSLTFDIGGRWSKFESTIGIDDSSGDGGTVVFRVMGDGRKIFDSGLVRGTDASPKEISVPIQGVKRLTLSVTAGDDLDLGDVANWASARLVKAPATP